MFLIFMHRVLLAQKQILLFCFPSVPLNFCRRMNFLSCGFFFGITFFALCRRCHARLLQLLMLGGYVVSNFFLTYTQHLATGSIHQLLSLFILFCLQKCSNYTPIWYTLLYWLNMWRDVDAYMRCRRMSLLSGCFKII